MSNRFKHICKDVIITSYYIALATIFSYIFFLVSNNTTNVAIIFIMTTVLVARNTNGYTYGIISAFIGVVAINFVYTYPYMELDFTLDGYPVTFLCMLIISCITSTLTSHLKEQSRILQERDRMLMEAEKEKMRANLLRAISHDLRTPLTSIIGTSNNYLDRENTLTDREKSHMVATIAEDADWLLHMVENLLSVTRINDKTAQVKKTLEPIEEVIPAAVQRFHKRLPNAQVNLRIPDEFVMVPMDATLIQQVLINLLENTVYHSGSLHPIDLTVTTDNTHAIFQIRDYGKGIDSQNLDTIFDGYTVDQNHSSDSHKGMGIGLSICKTIISAHHGTIVAQNHTDGAEFIFTLPLGEHTHESKINSRYH